jgi:hypothetical protein
MEKLSEEIKKLRIRFISDLNLPIQVIHSPYFENMLDLLEDEYKAKTKYNDLLDFINNGPFNGNINKFIEDFHYVRNQAITSIENNESYQFFNTVREFKEETEIRLSIYDNYLPLKVEKKEVYIPDNDGYEFISIDLKHANYTALHAFNLNIVNGTNSYEEFIEGFCTENSYKEYLKNSKYTRQVIFGKLNPKRTITVENYMIMQIYNALCECTNINQIADLYTVKSDEIVFKLKNNTNKLEGINYGDCCIIDSDYPIHVTRYRLKHYQFAFETSDAKLNVYEQHRMDKDGNIYQKKLKCVPSTYMPQVYKLIHNQSITEDDLVFYYEHQLVKFMHPIKLIKK